MTLIFYCLEHWGIPVDSKWLLQIWSFSSLCQQAEKRCWGHFQFLEELQRKEFGMAQNMNYGLMLQSP